MTATYIIVNGRYVRVVIHSTMAGFNQFAVRIVGKETYFTVSRLDVIYDFNGSLYDGKPVSEQSHNHSFSPDI